MRPKTEPQAGPNDLNGSPLGPVRLSRRNGHKGTESTHGEWMRPVSRFIAIILFSGMTLLEQPPNLFSQEPVQGPIVTEAQELPEAPVPQFEIATGRGSRPADAGRAEPKRAGAGFNADSGPRGARQP